MSGIGLQNEKHLHASLKEWYARPDDQLEVKIGQYVIDIVRNDFLIEIQTGNFSAIKSKLFSLSKKFAVRLVYPIAKEKWIIKNSQDPGDKTSRRKSPKHGRTEDLFREMVSLSQLMVNPNFSLEILFIKEEEIRYFDPDRNWRRRGWGTAERRLIEVMDSVVFSSLPDWEKLIPPKFKSFTTKDISGELGISKNLAQKMLYCFRNSGLIESIGKQGRFVLYRFLNN